MKTGLVFLYLFRGYKDPQFTSQEIPVDGPVFGPYEAIHFDSQNHVHLNKSTGSDVLLRTENSIFYDGLYYREWVIRPELLATVTPYDSAKSKPLRLRRSTKTLDERFQRLLSICECAIEDRLSILQEDDPDKRDYLLTSDIEDQIAHWQAIEEEVARLSERA
jgi:hypothetical protein